MFSLNDQGTAKTNGHAVAMPLPTDGPVGASAPQNATRTMAGVLGEIVWLMSQSPMHKQFFISDIEWFAMTPALLRQFRLFYDKEKPVGVLFWALVNDEVEERLSTGGGRLRPKDWKCGDNLWVVELVAPFGPVGAGRVSLPEAMVADFKEKVFPANEIKMLVRNPDGKLAVRIV